VAVGTDVEVGGDEENDAAAHDVWRQFQKWAGRWLGGVEITRPALRDPMRADAMRRGAVRAGAPGCEPVSDDALRREVMGANALRRGALSAGALSCERVSADAPRGDAR